MQDLTHEMTTEELVEIERRNRRRESGDTERVIRRIGVPIRIRNLYPDGFERTQAVEAVEEWVAQPDHEAWCLVLGGPVGVGKSAAAGKWLCDWAETVDDHPRMVEVWHPAAELVAMSSFGDELKDIAKLGRLVIDDIGAEYIDAKGSWLSQFDRLIDARYRECRRTIITTNLKAPQFVERYSQRILDRMRDGGLWVELSGESRRGKR